MKRALIFLCLCGCALAPAKTPDELAVYTNCEPERIAYWIDNRIEYHRQVGWIPAETSMSLERGDCKAKAQIAVDTLNRCVGYEAHIKILKGRNKYHAVAVFTDHKGRRGFVDSGTMKLYPSATPWSFVVLEIPGGPWTDI